MRMKKLFVALAVILSLLSFGSRVPSEGGYGLFAPIRLQHQEETPTFSGIADDEPADQSEADIEAIKEDLNRLAKNRDESNVGYCTGDYVRVREKPSTDAEIFGRVHKGNKLTVVGNRSVNNQLWYEIENPFGDGTAWISASYVKISDNASGQKSVPVKTANSKTPKFSGFAGDEPDLTARTNNTRITSTASSQNEYDVPDFFAIVNDGNLRAVEKKRGTGYIDKADPHKIYKYECDVNKYNNYVERYIQSLNSYNFSLTTHYVESFRRVAHIATMLESEIWVISYNGSKRVSTFRYVNLKTPKHPHIAPFMINKDVYHHEGVTKISIEIADELTYAGENAFVNNVRPTQTRQSNSDSSSYSSSSGSTSIRERCFSCHGSGTVDCSVCGGDGGRYEYDSSTPNFAGRTDPMYYATKRVWVPCRNFKCRNGKVECSRCNGTGYVN